MAIKLRQGGRSIVGINGLGAVLSNLNKELSKVEGGTASGVLAAAKYVEGESNEMVPQKYGVLLNSSFAKPEVPDAAGPRAVVGYSAEYATVVHEMPETNNFTKPGTGPKFLQRAIANNVRQIIEVIRKRARL